MVHRCLMMLAALSAGLLCQGCFSSESDYNILVAEKDTLAEEIKEANRENEILTRALTDVKKEQESLQTTLNAAHNRLSSTPAAPAGSGGTSSADGSGGNQTINWGGWEWSIPSDAPAAGGGSSSSTQAAANDEPSGRIYRPKSGDVLSTIALRHNTTVEKLVELNPYLARRRNYMIWETDKIVLP